MEPTRIDRLVNGLTQATIRRDALRSLGASGLVLLAALGLTDASAKGSHMGDNARVQADGKGKKNRKKKRGPAGFKFATRVVVSAKSDPLTEATGSLVSATAECGGEGEVVSCGYQVDAEAEPNVNVVVQAALPNTERSSCTASLLRTLEVGSSTSFRSTIQAVAICLV